MAQVGDRIGPFELVERVARGRRTSLFHGVRTEGGGRGPREVALRVADPVAPDTVAALQLEYDVLRLVEDERVPRAIAMYEGHGAVALEWLRTASLRQTLSLVEQGRIDLEAATSIDILVELAYALRNVHALSPPEGRIVHGTLAPEVVHLTATGRVVLYGLADPDPSHTWPLAPEQQRGVTELRTDQWLLGALGLELLRHAPQVLKEAQGEPIEKVFGLLQARWPAVTRVLARALAEAPDARYEVEERFVKDLLAVARTLGSASRRAEVGARTLQLAHLADSTDAPAVDADALLKSRAERRTNPPAVRPTAPRPEPEVPAEVRDELLAVPVQTAPVPIRGDQAWDARGPSVQPEALSEVLGMPVRREPPAQIAPEARQPLRQEPPAPAASSSGPARLALATPSPFIGASRSPEPPRPSQAALFPEQGVSGPTLVEEGDEPDDSPVLPAGRAPMASISLTASSASLVVPTAPKPPVTSPIPEEPPSLPSLTSLLPAHPSEPDEEATQIDTRGVVEHEEVGDFDWEATGDHRPPDLPEEILPSAPAPRLRLLEPEPRVAVAEPPSIPGAPRVRPEEPDEADSLSTPVEVEADRAREPVADPVPDRWVGIAVAVFGLVAIGVMVWALTR